MTIRITEGSIHLLDLTLRMPFKYGIATMTECPHAFVRLHVEIDGGVSVGIAADHLPPKWFTKDPERDVEDEVLEMARVIEHAVDAALDLEAESVFAFWQELHHVQSQWGDEEGLPALLTQFGTSLVERAVMDSCCRLRRQTFASVIRGDAFGLRVESIHPELRGQRLEFLPPSASKTVLARHTVGLADPLTDDDISDENRLADGLPQSLESCIRRYGLRHFKIKVTGDLDKDRERVPRLAKLFERVAPTDYAFSFDGNEQFRSAESFRDYWEQLERKPGLAGFFEHLLFVEQPFHRDIALDASAVGSLSGWEDRPAMIIDESDAELSSMATALGLGYVGTSHKNCKGVFKTLANACLLDRRRQEEPGRTWLLSGEDLANIGPVALLQDLAVCGALGIESVERNGHHYFAGLSMVPEELQRQMLERHDDLYTPSEQGWPTLAVSDGRVSLESINSAPFGVHPLPEVDEFPTLAEWRKRRSNSPE